MTTTAAAAGPSHHVLAATRDLALDVIAANRQQERLLTNRTAEYDSIVDDLRMVRRVLLARGIDADALLAGMASRLRQAIDLNAVEYRGEHTIAGTLDALARMAHANERDANACSALGVRALSRALRDPLRTLAAARFQDPAGVYAACRTLVELLADVPRERLTGSLAAQLGAGPHATLLALLGEVAA